MSDRLNIYQKLLKVKKTVKYLKKDAKGDRFDYVSSSHVLGSIRETMNDEGLLLTPEVIESKVINYRNKTQKESMVFFTELKVKFTWIDTDNPDSKIECPWYGQGMDIEGEKGAGKAFTYAEKYFLLKFFNIPTDKDDPDAFQNNHKSSVETSKEQIEKNELVEEYMKLVGSIKFPAKDKKIKDYVSTVIKSFKKYSLDNMIMQLDKLKEYKKTLGDK